MKRLISFILFICFGLSAHTQNKGSVFYDAKFLKDSCYSVEDGKFFGKKNLDAVFSKYFPNKKVDFNDSMFKAILKKDSFLAAYIPSGSVKTDNDKLSFSDISSSFGSLNVTNIADGLARFLIKRGKEELNVAFFNRLKIFFEDPKYPEARTLFPNTTEYLTNIASYRYSELIQSLREVFYKDLNNLIVSMNELIDLPKYKDLLENLPEIRVAIRSVKIVSELSQSSTNKPINPATVIRHLADLNEWKEIHPNIGNSFALLNVISQSLLSNDSTHIWVTLSELNELVNDNVRLKIFLGLLYLKVNQIEFSVSGTSPVKLQEFMNREFSDDRIYAVSNLIENFGLLANDIDRTIADFKDKKEKNTLSNDDYYSYISKSINIIEYGFKVANTINPKIAGDKYISIAKNANDLYKSIYTKNYNNAVMNAYNILDQIFNHASDLANEKIVRKSLTANDEAAIKKASTDSMPDVKTIEKILKYGNFIASVVKATTPEEVQSAVEAAALPAGSSSIKKNASWNIAINAYVGYYTGPRLSSATDGWHNNSGVTAPIGITISKSLGKAGNLNLGSLSAFSTLLNIGSIVDYRLNDDHTAIKQEIKLENIFSPGGYIVYGFLGNVPLSIGYGWQYGPRLFKVNADQLNLTDKPGWRHNWIFTIDIPLFNIWTKNNFNKSK